MKKNFSLAMLAGGLLLLTGCSKNMNPFQADYFNCNPNPLEVVGQTVPATVTGNVPAKFFKKNATVTVTPVLVYGDQEKAATSVTFQGENVRGNNQVVSYEYGGTVTVPVNYIYEPAMQKSELYLAFEVEQGNKQYALPRVKVADGIIATAALADAKTVSPALTPDGFQRIINEQYSAEIKFLINRANIRPDQLTSPQMEAFNSDLAAAAQDTNRVIEGLNIKSYASPDGPYAFNTKLAEEREDNTKSYLEGQLKKDKITEFGELTADFTPEDWEGFQKLVSESNIQDKQLILSVLSMYKDPEQREAELRNLAAAFEVLADDILPQLRYSRLTASINVIGKSDAEINQLFDTDPKALTVDELLYAATLTDDLARKNAIYTACTKQYPDDYRGWNNLGLVEYEQGNISAAANDFAKAAKLAPNNGEIALNQGLIALNDKNFNEAQALFGKAAGVPETNDALGTLYLEKGDAAAAVKAFGNSKTNNAALAQILTKDYSKAKATLAGVQTPDATTYYLTAVLGARTNNAEMVTSNLKKAIELDPALATQAANDLEFSQFNISSVL
ncbi:MAG: tetratricopeptide repeat protein [Bacteroidales bacterium]|nr:tetratricopeptide repeat protein [Bacteroidales bacterium]